MGTTGERVVPYDLGVEWEPNTSDPVLMQHGVNAHLAVDPYFDDNDRRLVVIRLRRCQGVWLGYPNDEGISGHRLYRRGLSDCRWTGEVLESEWIESIVTVASAHRRFSRESWVGLRHWILLFKDKTAECIAREISVTRVTKADLTISLLDYP